MLLTRLEDESDNIEILEARSGYLNEVVAQINSTAALVDSMYTVDPNQSVVMLKAQSTGRAPTETKVNVCNDLIAIRQAAINHLCSDKSMNVALLPK